VIFGQRRPDPIDARRLGGHGYEIYDSRGSGILGTVAMNVGDFNGDGRPDAVVSEAPDVGDRNHLYVVFGRSRPGRVDVRHLGTSGLDLVGPFTSSSSSVDFSVAAPGDLNGDGRADIVAGDVQYTRACRADIGAAFVVYGRSRGGVLDVAHLPPSAGYRLEGERNGDALGSIVQSAGDFNGDGRPDLLVGATNDGPPLGPFQLDVFTGRPANLRVAPDIPLDSCLRVRLLDRSLTALRSGRGLRVRVSLRRLQRAVDDVGVELFVDEAPVGQGPPSRGAAEPVQLPIAAVRVRIRRPGARTVRLRLPPLERRALPAQRSLLVNLKAGDLRTKAFDLSQTLRLSG
jgi:hypothetical protein